MGSSPFFDMCAWSSLGCVRVEGVGVRERRSSFVIHRFHWMRCVASPAMKAGGRSTAVQMRAEGEIGVTPPLGVYDPLNILATPVIYPRKDYRRYQELEIKHGFDDEPTRPHKIQGTFTCAS